MDKYIWTEEELPQGSKLWKEMRQTCVGGSDMATVLGANKYETPKQLWSRKIGKTKPKVENEAMAYGTALEPEAREVILKELESEFKNPVGIPYFVKHPDFPYIGISYDGVDIENKFTLEIKCPKMVWNFRSVFEDGIQDYYYPQVQMGLFVAKRVWDIKVNYFASYYPHGAYILDWKEYKEYLKTLCILDIDYDEKYCLAANKVVKVFWDAVQAKEWDNIEYGKILKEFKEEIND